MLKPCCIWLKSMLLRAGEAGTSVVASFEWGEPQFVIHARPITRHQADVLSQLGQQEATRELLAPLYTNEHGRLAPIHVLLKTPIQFCPYCGTNLMKLAKSQRTAFEELAREHQPFNER